MSPYLRIEVRVIPFYSGNDVHVWSFAKRLKQQFEARPAKKGMGIGMAIFHVDE
jgi:hypothetical protein